MREMQRNADRSIGALDVMPGGHNALVRAHEDMVDPLMAALTGQGNGNTAPVDVEAYSQQNQGNPNNEALPNPWGAPAPAPAAPAPASAPVTAAPTAPPALGAGFPAFGAQTQTGAAPQA